MLIDFYQLMQEKIDYIRNRYSNNEREDILVKIRDNIYRVAELDEEINKEILNFKNQEEIYYSI